MFGATPLPRTLEAALRDLGAAKPEDRASSVRDLARHADDARERVIRGLVRALRDEAGEVRVAAATALADLGAGETLAELLLAVDDDHALVRQMAIAALGEIGDPRATERLRRALRDGRAEVRFQAVIAFPRVSASREDALDALLAATEDKDPLVCQIALRMAEELRDDGRVDGRMLARARALLDHASADVRVASAVLLGRAGEASGAVAAILEQAARGGLAVRDQEDVAAAIELAGELDLAAARPGLERRAFGGLLGLRRDRFAWNARVALARMGHERAIREILSELGSGDRDVRTLAVAAAGRARLVAARDRIAAMRGRAALVDPQAVDEALAALTPADPRPEA